MLQGSHPSSPRLWTSCGHARGTMLKLSGTLCGHRGFCVKIKWNICCRHICLYSIKDKSECLLKLQFGTKQCWSGALMPPWNMRHCATVSSRVWQELLTSEQVMWNDQWKASSTWCGYRHTGSHPPYVSLSRVGFHDERQFPSTVCDSAFKCGLEEQALHFWLTGIKLLGFWESLLPFNCKEIPVGFLIHCYSHHFKDSVCLC